MAHALTQQTHSNRPLYVPPLPLPATLIWKVSKMMQDYVKTLEKDPKDGRKYVCDDKLVKVRPRSHVLVIVMPEGYLSIQISPPLLLTKSLSYLPHAAAAATPQLFGVKRIKIFGVGKLLKKHVKKWVDVEEASSSEEEEEAASKPSKKRTAPKAPASSSAARSAKKAKGGEEGTKRAPSAFMNFCSQERASVLAENPGIAFGQVSQCHLHPFICCVLLLLQPFLLLPPPPPLASTAAAVCTAVRTRWSSSSLRFPCPPFMLLWPTDPLVYYSSLLGWQGARPALGPVER